MAHRMAKKAAKYTPGLSNSLPQGAVAVLTAVVELSFLPMEHWGAALSALMAWLLAQSGVCLFFFSFAAFCAMFTGHILALPAFYGILNVLAGVIYEPMAHRMAKKAAKYTPGLSNSGRLSARPRSRSILPVVM